MARYIDGDKLLEYYEERHKNLCKKNGETDAYCQGYEDAMYAAEHLDFTADVVPKSEADLYKRQVDELEDELASTYDKLENTKAEVARKIFEEIEKFSQRFMNDEHYIFGDMVWDIAELKKKYTEGEK